MFEIVELVVRVIFTVLIETIGSGDLFGRSKYRRYLDTVAAGENALSKREWREAGRPAKAATSGNAVQST